jgi:hypothetical protein
MFMTLKRMVQVILVGHKSTPKQKIQTKLVMVVMTATQREIQEESQIRVV